MYQYQYVSVCKLFNLILIFHAESTWELPDSKVPPTANQSAALPAQESEAPPLPESETLPAPESIPLPPQESETALPTQESGAPSLQESSSFSIDLSEIKVKSRGTVCTSSLHNLLLFVASLTLQSFL